jgi:hypothetical protein
MSVRDAVDELAVAQSTINQKQWVSGCGLLLPEDREITRNEHIIIATYLGTIDDVGSWGRGDQVVRIQNDLAKQYGKKTERYNAELAARINELLTLYRNVSYKTLENNATTARSWPFATRWQTPTLGFSHHYVLNSFTEAEREYYMDMAEVGKWSVARLQEELFNKRGATPPGVSIPDMQRVAELFKWGGIPATITPNECRWQTPGGTVILRSESPITWEVVK